METTLSNSKQTGSLDYRRLIPILVIVLVDVMGLTILMPILPYYVLAFDASPFVIGLLISTYPVMQLIFVPILGSLSDRVGRKPVLAVAQVGTFISLLILGFAHTLWLVFFSQIIDGITGANLATVRSAMADSTSPQNRAKGLGLIGAVFGIGFLLGPVLSGVALRLSGNNYSAPAFAAAGFAFVSIILTTFVFKETLPPKKRSSQPVERKSFGQMIKALHDPNLGILMTLIFNLRFQFGIFTAVFAPFMLSRLGLDSFGTAIIFILFGLVSVVVQGGLIGRLSQQFGERQLVLAGMVLYALGFFLMGFTPEQTVPWYSRDVVIEELSQTTGTAPEAQLALLPEDGGNGVTGLFLMIAFLAPVPIGYALLQPSLNSLVTKRVEPQNVGQALGVGAAFMSAGTVLGPIIGGFLFTMVGAAAPFIINGVIGFILYLLARQRLTPRPDDVYSDLAAES